MSLIDGLGSFGQFLSEAATGDQVRDWQHATRLFVDGLYRLSPKMSTMFHVYIDLNQSVSNGLGSGGQGALAELGMLAKTVALPSFTMNTQTYNQYNRKNIAQKAIKYEPVTMTFHDDSADVVRNFWYDYYSHYYRDSDYSGSVYGVDNKYTKDRYSGYWGYTPRTDKKGAPYINSIRIYSLHQKRFSSYTLLRPIITAFKHGQHEAGKYEGMEHSMTIAYEAVKYDFGRVNAGTVYGMQSIHYDHGPSPLSALGGGTASLFGPGGLVDSISDVGEYLGQGNILAAGIAGLHTYKNFKNANMKQMVSGELSQIGVNVLKSQIGGNRVFVPPPSSLENLGSPTSITRTRSR
jgi:hypothetical protein